MKSKLIASLLAASFLVATQAAFASGYGPAPSYEPSIGAPASQRGPSELTIAAQGAIAEPSAYGGTANVHAQSSRGVPVEQRTTVFTYH